jgi:hypothetical protein
MDLRMGLLADGGARGATRPTCDFEEKSMRAIERFHSVA